jgi:AraC family transcriptional regulator
MTSPSTRRTLFKGPALRVAHWVTRPLSAACGGVERSAVDVLVLPLAGSFARHDSARREVLIDPNHATLFARDRPYRISNPGGMGDECLTLVFAPDALARLLCDTVAADSLASAPLAPHCLLPPAALLGRALFHRRLLRGDIDALEVEETGLALWAAALRAACTEPRRAARAARSDTAVRRRRQVETVKQAICTQPQEAWSLASLAALAHTSPYQLTRVFRDDVGVPVHRYLVRVRLARALEAVVGGGADLTALAMDNGFASHSHFSSSFRALFGIAPSALRHGGAARALAHVRKNLTAPAVARP